MAQIKCEECGQMFSENEASCPNCDCPNGKEIVSNVEHHLANEIATTDTGYEYETAVKNYADITFIIAVIVGFLLYFLTLAMIVPQMSGAIVLLVAVMGLLILGVYIYCNYLLKACLRVYVNMSINLHEINKKLQ